MKKRLLSTLLALSMVLALLPSTVLAASNLPDWYFLFAIFKSVDADVTDGDGVTTHAKYTMTQEEVDIAQSNAKAFEAYMDSLGVMRTHVDVVEIDGTVTELSGSSGSYLDAAQAAPLLEGAKVDLNRYDLVFSIISLDVRTGNMGMTGNNFTNGTGHSSIFFKNQEYAQTNCVPEADFPYSTFLHEFMHFMEKLSKKWGTEFNLHNIMERFSSWDAKTRVTNIILNRVKGNAETGTGVAPAAWQYPPHALRTISELTIPEGVTSIGDRAFYSRSNLESVTIPTSVTSIGYAAFYNTNVKDVYYGGTETQWNAIQFGDFNSALTKANIHYNRVAFSDVPADAYYAQPVVWAVANGVTGGTGNGKFSPGQTCNQAQILTFLWRAKGEPKPAAAVSSNEYYAKAAQWAKEQGLTDDFSAETPCTRAMVVTYLWKLAGSPVEGASGFRDVSAGASYAQAVAWAVKNGVTSGTGNGAFSPDQTCTRAQIVTFLYRALGK